MWQPRIPAFDQLASAIYALDREDQPWLADVLGSLLRDCGDGVVAACFGWVAARPDGVDVVRLVATDIEFERTAPLSFGATPVGYVPIRLQNFAATDRQLFGDELASSHYWQQFVLRRGASDNFVVFAPLPDRELVGLAAVLRDTADAWPSALVEEWEAVAMHLACGTMLRRAHQLGSARREGVFTTSGECVHAEGAVGEQRDLLRDAIRRIERSRSRFRDVPGQSDARRPLIEGTWTLVDEFESDGKHFLVAYATQPESDQVAQLSRQERAVVDLLVAGWSMKRIAYHLGLSEGAVASYAHRATKKLNARQRVARGPGEQS